MMIANEPDAYPLDNASQTHEKWKKTIITKKETKKCSLPLYFITFLWTKSFVLTDISCYS